MYNGLIIRSSHGIINLKPFCYYPQYNVQWNHDLEFTRAKKETWCSHTGVPSGRVVVVFILIKSLCWT